MATAGPGKYGVTSDNVEHIAFVPFEVGTATGAKVVGKYLYVTSWKSFSIYDVSDPLDPEHLAQAPFGFKFENENVSTNGKIMLFAEQAPVDSLHVWDVEDKTNPTEIADLDGGGTHTATCILDCRVLVRLLRPRRPRGCVHRGDAGRPPRSRPAPRNSVTGTRS